MIDREMNKSCNNTSNELDSITSINSIDDKLFEIVTHNCEKLTNSKLKEYLARGFDFINLSESWHLPSSKLIHNTEGKNV